MGKRILLRSGVGVLLVALGVMAGHSQTSEKSATVKSKTWRQLFNGKDLTGWKHVGPGEDTVEDGMIHTHGGMGLLYWTGGKVSNSRLKVVYKMRDHNSNSGVFIRIPVEPREERLPVHSGDEVHIEHENEI